MTKKEAESFFRRTFLPLIREQEKLMHRRGQGRCIDYAARSQAWNDWTDSLMKDGKITEYQYSNWLHPSCNYRPDDKLELIRKIMHN